MSAPGQLVALLNADLRRILAGTLALEEWLRAKEQAYSPRWRTDRAVLVGTAGDWL